MRGSVRKRAEWQNKGGGKKKRASRKGNEGRGGEMKRRSYPSDLSEREWAILEPLIPPAKPGGHPRTTDMREVINAILHLDTMGLIAGVLVHEANIQDHDGGKELLWPLKGCLPRLQLIWAVSRLQE